MSARDATSQRRALLALVHKAGKQAGLADDDRRVVQQMVTGCASCADMNEAQLRAMLAHWRGRGVLPYPARGGGGQGGGERPSALQWRELERLAQAMGWPLGLEDEGLRGFVRRTTGLDGTRFLSARQASAVITGLRRWLASRAPSAHKAEEAEHAP